MSSLDDYIEKLNCLDETERIYAAEDIGYLNTGDGVAALLERLGKETSRAVRDLIFQALIRIDASPFQPDQQLPGLLAAGGFGRRDPQRRHAVPG